MLVENVADPFDDSVDGSIQAALEYRFLLNMLCQYVSRTQTKHQLTLSRPYSARKLETSSNADIML